MNQNLTETKENLIRFINKQYNLDLSYGLEKKNKGNKDTDDEQTPVKCQ